MAAAAIETRMGFRPARYLQYARALGTYTARPGIRWLAAGAVLFAAWYVVSGQARFTGREPLFSAILLRSILGFSPVRHALWLLQFALAPLFFLLPVIAAAALARHAREQVLVGRTLLIPHSTGPAVRAWVVATLVLLAGTTALMWDGFHIDVWPTTPTRRETSFLAVLDLALLLIAMSAWFGFFARSPWSTVLFACVLLTAMVQGMGRVAEWLIEREVYDLQWFAGRPPLYQKYLAEAQAAQAFKTMVRRQLFGVGALSLIVLAWRLALVGRVKRSRRRPVVADVPAVESRALPSSQPTYEPQLLHRPVQGGWQRLLLRRGVSPLGPGAMWVLGGVVMALSTLLTLLNDYIVSLQNTPMAVDPDSHVVPGRAVLLATVVPAVAAAGAWRTRQKALAYESLFPAHRTRFARETAAAVAVDLLSYWLACVVGAAISVAITRPQWLASPLFASALAASAASQCLALAGLLFAARSRPLAPHVIGPAAAAIAVAVLMAGLWPRQWFPQPGNRPIALGIVLIATAVVTLAGAMLSAVGFLSWRRAELG